MAQFRWQLIPPVTPPAIFVEQVRHYCDQSSGKFAAQLLWQRGIQSAAQLAGFLSPECYTPTSAWEFGQEMKWAVQRLGQAMAKGEKVTIWGDFDADGITSTAVLWEGLGQFLAQGSQLTYTIPNRLRESHGLNRPGLECLAAQGTKLIVTCDTGSTNLEEILYARGLGMDVIVTDHHTLPDDRPEVVAIINPRYFADDHPLFNLSGVAVAFKLVEALYEQYPTVPQQPLEQLLDLVAIGLIADLVTLQGDCRYLAQRGIAQLRSQKDPGTTTRPGIHALLNLCKRNGDRPTDIGFGIGPRINAISRIKGDARFGVELLTSRDTKICHQLAAETEILNSRRKGLQKSVTTEIDKRLQNIDLSTTGVIILTDPQWPTGVLGLAASHVAQTCGRPAILLNTQDGEIAKGSARSIANIDLYSLLQSQRHLLLGFGGHPFAAGLSLPLDKLPLFSEAVNQQFWQSYGAQISLDPILPVDLQVTVADLGQELFREFNLLEPYGMGNPAPKLLLENVQVQRPSFRNIKDRTGNKVSYLKTSFSITDYPPKTDDNGQPIQCPGIWWGHHPDELTQNEPLDLVVELDFNTYDRQYEVRLIDFRLHQPQRIIPSQTSANLIDRRSPHFPDHGLAPQGHVLRTCPSSWSELRRAYQQAIAAQQPLVLDYRFQPQCPETIVEELKAQWHKQQNPELSPLSLQKQWDFSHALACQILTLLKQYTPALAPGIPWPKTLIRQIETLIAEEQFQKQYFSQVPLTPEVLTTVADSI
ncbi:MULTISPECIES: single-stranded-DNA-specific exonuclease RecJ [unclassified Synechocystis]|uniref:single-stranded-DNA-specific exonuclease RecJ n=1 Tax=unclassified Synechocystis TaxID=2640012 RepID=UPI0004143256|nr:MULTISPECIES: single-stranded-DNA-specific exonuclease RecJ [unclassified Synechocystis]AIE73006.1 Single-stranded-DNA-specific exonuclease RecJ [Synechocystis sp. PCC 6714]MCT0253528.1 single-stranded-DNA-specific exonuclease RecJ [Synechocystis sp. CS-94]